MIERYLVLADRIRLELAELEQVVARTERAMRAARQRPEDQDLYVDSAALNLHDFYSGLERIFRQLAATVDSRVPASPEWHRELLLQMVSEVPELRPAVLSDGTAEELAEFMRFRHVVRNVYAFALDPVRVGRLVERARPAYEKTRAELLHFAGILERVGRGE